MNEYELIRMSGMPCDAEDPYLRHKFDVRPLETYGSCVGGEIYTSSHED